MYRCLTRFIVALLVILGDNAYTSEQRLTTDSFTPQLSQSDQTEQFKPDPQPSSSGILSNNFLSTQITLYYALTITLSETHTFQHHYTTYSARAPPVIHPLV